MNTEEIVGKERSLFNWLIIAIVGFGSLLSVFDVLRKTVFVNASWNYQYQYWNFVYDYVALFLLVLAISLVVITAPKWLRISSDRFALALLLGGIVVFTLALFALPIELTRALDLDKRGLYNGAVYLIQNGPIDFLRSFNTLPQTAPANTNLYIHSFDIAQEDAAANAFAQWFSGLEWVPFNESLGNYVGAYTAQKHGPVSVLFITPFLVLLGTSTAAALAGSVVIATLIPVVGYYTFRLYFEEMQSRIGAVLVATAPGLFIWTRHAAPVPYDIVTGFLVACSFYTFFRGIQSNQSRFFAGTGVLVALATMTKFTGFVVVLPLAIVLSVGSETPLLLLKRGGIILSSWIVTVLVFLLAGYNAIAQWLYTAYKTTLYTVHRPSAGTRPAGSPADVLNNELIAIIGTLYNVRWMSVVLLVLAVVFVGFVLYDRNIFEQSQHAVSLALLTAFIPFAVWVIFSAGTLSRHTIMLIIPLGFVALSGFSIVVDHEQVANYQLVRFCQISLIIGWIQFLINI